GFMLKREKGSYMKKPLFSIAVNPQIYPELSRVENFVWVYNGPLARKDFNKTYCKKKKWRDMRISYYPEDFYFTFELKGKEDLCEMTAFPRTYSQRDVEFKTAKMLSKLYTSYSKSLNKTSVRFEHNLKKNQARIIAKFKRENIREWEKVKPMMSDSEKLMSCDEWVIYYLNLQDSLARYNGEIRKAELAVLNASSVSPNNMMQSFTLDGLGIWNCDRLLRNEEYIPVVAEYIDKEDNRIPAGTTYVLDLEANGVLTYSGNDISVHKSNRSVLIVKGKKNELYIVTDQEITRAINNTESNKKHFVAKEVAEGTSVEDFRKLTGTYFR
ncbi:MAG: hypothetical protein V2A54_12440, partial [Bacteroidota bacterium]